MTINDTNMFQTRRTIHMATAIVTITTTVCSELISGRQPTSIITKNMKTYQYFRCGWGWWQLMIPIQRMKITSNISCGRLPRSLYTEDSASTCASEYSSKLGGDIWFIRNTDSSAVVLWPYLILVTTGGGVLFSRRYTFKHRERKILANFYQFSFFVAKLRTFWRMFCRPK